MDKNESIKLKKKELTNKQKSITTVFWKFFRLWEVRSKKIYESSVENTSISWKLSKNSLVEKVREIVEDENQFRTENSKRYWSFSEFSISEHAMKRTKSSILVLHVLDKNLHTVKTID